MLEDIFGKSQTPLRSSNMVEDRFGKSNPTHWGELGEKKTEMRPWSCSVWSFTWPSCGLQLIGSSTNRGAFTPQPSGESLNKFVVPKEHQPR